MDRPRCHTQVDRFLDLPRAQTLRATGNVMLPNMLFHGGLVHLEFCDMFVDGQLRCVARDERSHLIVGQPATDSLQGSNFWPGWAPRSHVGQCAEAFSLASVVRITS